MNALKTTLIHGLAVVAVVVTTASASTFDLRTALSSAKPGDTIRVPAGVYDGPITIDRPLVLLGEPGAIIDGHAKGNVVTIKAAGAVLRNLTVRGSGDSLDKDETGIWVSAPNVTVESCKLDDVLFGICVHQAKGSVVRHNAITGKNLDIARKGDAIRVWYSPDCTIDSNEVHDVRDVVIWFSSGVKVTNNHVSRSRYGLHFMFCDDNVLTGNRLEDNSVGCYLMNSRKLTLHGNILANNRGSSGYGIGLKDMDGVDAQDNRIIGNKIGVYIDTSPQSVDVYDYFTRNFIAYNDVGVSLLPSCRRNQFQDNAFVENQEQVAIMGGGKLEGNAFTVNGRGNFWSDYKGFDQNGDGIGDLPYRSQSLFENLMDREPKLRLFLYSPSQQALELASQAFPAVKPRAKFVDDAPLMQPVALHVPAEAAAFAWPSAGAGAVMLALASAAVVAARGRGRLPVAPASRLCERSANLDAYGVADQNLCPHGRDAHATGRLAGSSVLSINRLTKRFGKFVAVDDLSFELEGGKALALWGTNGAGKTTAIRCVMGLVRSQSGRIAVCGRELRSSGKSLRGMIGYVPQESGFQGDLTVFETLRLYARLKAVPIDRVATLLGEVGLADHGSKRVANLSGGMRKRLALAAALLNDPPLLVLDEIAANLDTEARQSFISLLCDLKAKGKTILFTSHRLDEVESLADRVIVLERGRLRHDCEPRKLTQVLGLRCEVKLLLGPSSVETAIGILRAEGFAARRNGRGIWVRVEPDRKAAPIHVLARSRIVIDDFELDSQDAEQSHV